MTETILVAGTASHVGKSTVAAGLCRALADRGLTVAPFKAQNMSNNARVVLRSGGTDGDNTDGLDTNATDVEWGEIGVSQFVQAHAARQTPTTDHNPVLLKPTGDGESQLVVDGRAIARLSAGSYYEEYWEFAIEAVEDAYERLAREADVIVAEGAGSIAEINLHDRDLANVETAHIADASIVVCVDIERGGAFASLYGTIELLPASIRNRVVGAIITKFRGDESLLTPGIEEIEARTGVPILGVIPHADPGLPEEDSVSLPDSDATATRGADDGIPDERSVTVGVVRHPHISNATDVESLVTVPGVRVEYVPTTEAGGSILARVDALVIPGTKNTVDDCLTLRAAGLDEQIRAFDGPIVGICGGYQMLGERIRNAHREGSGDRRTIDAIGLLPVETRFSTDKRLSRTTVAVDGTGPIAGASGTVSGYEIHAGEPVHLEPVETPLEPDSAAVGSVLGTYLHGLFENASVRDAFVDSVYRSAGIERGVDDGKGGTADRPSLPTDPYDRAATLVSDHVAIERLGLGDVL
ncbi:cobyric acid synthase [Halovivax gelatinilyticus]|uniref:cobyric acid synthase n=1 Tax=Halovivax gelatinilyticus TaxID=2961597 RepID=UPI0020CA3F2A|nr:cobyric acid synthase [Halovivax gelatinilyticus]